jgi:hypothetical protein
MYLWKLQNIFLSDLSLSFSIDCFRIIYVPDPVF